MQILLDKHTYEARQVPRLNEELVHMTNHNLKLGDSSYLFLYISILFLLMLAQSKIRSIDIIKNIFSNFNPKKQDIYICIS